MKSRKKYGVIAAVVVFCALCAASCTKLEEDCDYKTNTNPKGIIIVNPDKIVK